MAAVLSRTRLAAHLIAGNVGPATRTAHHGSTHAIHGVLIPLPVHHRIVRATIDGVYLAILHGADNVGNEVVAAVRHGGGQIGYLQGRGRDFALPDGDGDNGKSVPVVADVLVVELGIGNHATGLAGQVHAQLIAIAHSHEMVLPARHSALHRTVLFRGAKHTVEIPAEIGIAGSGDGRHKGDGRTVAVATYVQALVVETATAGEGGLRRDDALLQADEGLRNLEGGAWGIGAHDRTIEHRAFLVVLEHLVILAAVATDKRIGVVGGTRGHTKDFARAGFDGDNRAELTLQQTLGQGLQVHVDAEREVLARLGLLVVLAILVVSLRSAAHIAQHDADTFLAAEEGLVRPLHTQFPDIVATLIIVVFFDVVLADFAHVA